MHHRCIGTPKKSCSIVVETTQEAELVFARSKRTLEMEKAEDLTCRVGKRNSQAKGGLDGRTGTAGGGSVSAYRILIALLPRQISGHC